MAIAITPVLTAANTTAPADGFCVFFWDSEYKLIPKGYGDSLGYTNYYGVLGNETFGLSGAYNGIRGAWLGVGFDLKGDFGTISNYKTGALSAWDGNALSAREGLSQSENNYITSSSSALKCVPFKSICEFCCCIWRIQIIPICYCNIIITKWLFSNTK